MQLADLFVHLLTGRLFSPQELDQVRREIRFQEAIRAHLALRRRVIDCAAAGPACSAPLGEISNHHICVLGRWMSGAGKRRYGHYSSFATLEEEHLRFHGIAQRVVEMARRDRGDEANELIRRELRGSSIHIVARLRRLSKVFDS